MPHFLRLSTPEHRLKYFGRKYLLITVSACDFWIQTFCFWTCLGKTWIKLRSSRLPLRVLNSTPLEAIVFALKSLQAMKWKVIFYQTKWRVNILRVRFYLWTSESLTFHRTTLCSILSDQIALARTKRKLDSRLQTQPNPPSRIAENVCSHLGNSISFFLLPFLEKKQRKLERDFWRTFR